MTAFVNKLNFVKGLFKFQVVLLAAFSVLLFVVPVTVFAGKNVSSNSTIRKVYPITPPNKPSRPVTPPVKKDKPVPPRRPVTPPVHISFSSNR